jgi:hypothetical protein
LRQRFKLDIAPSIVDLERVMPSAALQFPSGRGNRRSAFYRIAHESLRFIELLLAAIEEAQSSAVRYHELARLSDRELARQGLTRDRIARFAILGRRQ